MEDIYIKKQANEPQPNIFLLILIYYFVAYFLHDAISLLMKINSFAAFCSNNHVLYLSTFFILQCTFILLSVIFLISKYRISLGLLWNRTGARRLLYAIIVLLPLLYWHFSSLVGLIVLLRQTLALKYDANEWNAIISSAHMDCWSELGYGDSLHGVIYFSLLSCLFAPVFEEIMISGFLVNYICKKKNTYWALATAPIFFAALHIPAFGFGFGSHLLFLLWAGYSYVIIRFLTGNIIFCICAHTLVNIIVSLPKWIVAILYFSKS